MRPYLKWLAGLSILVAPGTVVPGSQSVRAQRSRIVEAVEVVGNRRLSAKDILSHVKTRPGEPFSAWQSSRDLQELVRLGVFDKTQLRVTSETGVRGGVVVVFEVAELPLLLEVKFRGLRGIEESEVIAALRERNISLVKDSVYDPVKIRAARLLIRELLASRGWPNTVVTIRSELGGTYVSIEFAVSYEQY
ncbi:MAG: POTRA domain-containing protein [Pyrinomonadaceae bacterium]